MDENFRKYGRYFAEIPDIGQWAGQTPKNSQNTIGTRALDHKANKNSLNHLAVVTFSYMFATIIYILNLFSLIKKKILELSILYNTFLQNKKY